jgi:hypothetical protein
LKKHPAVACRQRELSLSEVVVGAFPDVLWERTKDDKGRSRSDVLIGEVLVGGVLDRRRDVTNIQAGQRQG